MCDYKWQECTKICIDKLQLTIIDHNKVIFCVSFLILWRFIRASVPVELCGTRRGTSEQPAQWRPPPVQRKLLMRVRFECPPFRESVSHHQLSTGTERCRTLSYWHVLRPTLWSSCRTLLLWRMAAMSSRTRARFPAARPEVELSRRHPCTLCFPSRKWRQP